MLKFVIVGLIISTVSAAPLESTSSEKSKKGDSPITHVLIRPSPINPDIPMDPKPPERIILDDTKSERDQRSVNDNDKRLSHGSHENTKSVHDHSDKHDVHSHEDHHDEHSNEHSNEHSDEHSDEDSVDETSHEEHHDEKFNKHNSDKEDHHGDKRENDLKVLAKSDLPLKQPKELIQPAKSGEPTIVYAVKADEKRSAADNFETSHRIPHINESERTFETSHHIPAHIEEERTKVVKNAKVEQKTE